MKPSSSKEKITSSAGSPDGYTARFLRRGAISCLSSIPTVVAYDGIVRGVQSARKHHLFNHVSQALNPLEHVNNVTGTLALDAAFFVITGAIFSATDRNITPRGKRILAGGAMVTGLALNAIVEIPQMQPLVAESHLFSSSTPDVIDFLYGAVGSYALARGYAEAIGHVFTEPAGNGDMLTPKANHFTGPSEFNLIQNPQQYQSVNISV